MSQTTDEYDSPWKEALELFLRPILEFCFPEVAAAIDWTKGVEFLDKELQEITRDSALGQQHVDKLIKVTKLDGSEKWILLHIEVQNYPDPAFPERVYQYNHRVGDRFGWKVVTLAILADESPNWRPDHFEEEQLGCKLRFDFPTCKLLDLIGKAEEMLATAEPSAVIIMANWATQQTRKNMEERRRWKWELTRRLYEANLGKQKILELYRLLDWMMRLPKELEREYKQELREYEERRTMRYVTTGERESRAEGLEEGILKGLHQGLAEGLQKGQLTALQESVLDALEVRFEEAPYGVMELVKTSVDVAQLKRWHRLALTSPTLVEFENALRQ